MYPSVLPKWELEHRAITALQESNVREEVAGSKRELFEEPIFPLDQVLYPWILNDLVNVRVSLDGERG